MDRWAARLEREAGVKHECLHGEVFAMAGVTLEHARLASRVISQRSQRVEVFRKTGTGTWELLESGVDDRVNLTSIDVRFAVRDVYTSALEA